ncbi:MAG: stage II sporulation protein R, partial [Clostridiales bacterium]|nr:stage II sporulation protein R [Candidatus Apopatousia equi]
TIIFILLFIIIGLSVPKNSGSVSLDTSDFLRIHIRANSNLETDQNIKYTIKDEFVNFLTPLICECESKDDAIRIVNENKKSLENIADKILNDNGYQYKSNIDIRREQFPTRTYDGYTLESGVYDSIIVELGSASGNNWWCVIYPPLCFTNYNSNYQNVVYKSKIMEIINKFFEKG